MKKINLLLTTPLLVFSLSEVFANNYVTFVVNNHIKPSIKLNPYDIFGFDYNKPDSFISVQYQTTHKLALYDDNFPFTINKFWSLNAEYGRITYYETPASCRNIHFEKKGDITLDIYGDLIMVDKRTQQERWINGKCTVTYSPATK